MLSCSACIWDNLALQPPFQSLMPLGCLHTKCLGSPTGGHEGLADTYIQGLASARSPAVRQGSAAALRALPYRLLQPHWRAALIALGQASQVCRCPSD